MGMRRIIKANDLATELEYSASTSSGPGGQNVNKVNSRIILRFDLAHSALLSNEEKELLLKKLEPKLTKDGVLILSAQEKRSQLQNKESVNLKLEKLMEKALLRKKPRRPTKPGKAAVQKRINSKKQLSEKKKWRQKL